MASTSALRALDYNSSDRRIVSPKPIRHNAWKYANTSADEMSMSDSDGSNASPHAARACFCGQQVDDSEGGIYCSSSCARADAFSSLCYRPNSCSVPLIPFPKPFEPISNASTSSFTSQEDPFVSSASTSSSGENTDEWNASHYRRIARADIRREERKEERRKRRGDMTSRSASSSISSTYSRDVPDLVGGHSRNPSIASTVSSAYTVGSLSRNPSSASTASSSRYGNRPTIDTVIMEDDDEEWLLGSSESKPYAMPRKHRRKGSQAKFTDERMKAFGMGKDMRDVLEEIIQMEKGFSLSDTEDALDGSQSVTSTSGIFTATFDRPPRTPSPTSEKRQSLNLNPPGAPSRGHRVSMSYQAPPGPLAPSPRVPASNMMGHHSSLSESHTALYLATASPAGPGRRSISPRLATRKSLTFTPDNAGPSIGSLRAHRFDSPAGATPSRRRGLLTPNAFHPTMDGWKFPTAPSNAATPTRPPPIDTTNIPGNFSTPTGLGIDNLCNARLTEVDDARNDVVRPQLLWPPTVPPPLAPALFPASPAFEGQDYAAINGSPTRTSIAPRSGLRLGVLLGSGDDVEMNDEETEQGHDMIGQSMGAGFLPVYLENGYRWD